MAEPKGQRADRRADRGPHDQGEHDSSHAAGGGERLAAANEAMYEHRRNHHLEQVPACLAKRGAKRQRHVVVRQQIADHHARPELQAEQIQERDPDADR